MSPASDMTDSRQALDRIFKARSVAVVGASTDPGKLGHMTLDSIIRGGFSGRLFPVNPKAPEVLGLPAYPSLTAIPEPVDLAVIIVPARFTAGVVAEAGRKGVPGAVVLTAGFREAGRADLERELAQAATTGGVRFVGPNVQGVNYLPNRLCAMFFPVITTRGPLTVITQSGSATAALSEWAEAEGLGINAAVNLGNQTDLTEADYLSWFGDDEATGAVAMYLEGVADGRRFIRSALEVTAAKPVVILKSGSSEAGRAAAASHTGSLAGRHRIFEAACRQAGVETAGDMTELYDRAKGLAALDPPRGNRLLSISTSGGMGALAADAAHREWLELPPLPQAFVRALEEADVSPLANMANPLDLGYVGVEAFRKATLLADEHDVADVILLNLGDPVPGAVEAATELKAGLKAGLAVSYLGGGAEEKAARPLIQRAGIPVFASPERAVKGIGSAVRSAMYRRARRAAGRPALADWISPSPRTGTRAAGRVLTEPEAAALISDHGLAYPDHRLARTADEAEAAALEVGLPVVLKIVSPQASHKTDIGGVLTGLDTVDGVREGFKTLTGRLAKADPLAQCQGVLVCAQAPAGTEVIIGGIDDPTFGPTVMFGLGGVTAEALADVSFRLAPLERRDALEMIREIRGHRLLSGWRGAPPADLDALARMLVSVSEFITANQNIRELDLNPVRVLTQGALALDVRLVLDRQRKDR